MRSIAAAFYRTLLTTQLLPPQKMLQYQRQLIEALVRHARAYVPFYRDTGRLDVLFDNSNNIDWSRWCDVPIFSRHEAQNNRNALVSEYVPANMGKTISGATTGSTGEPFDHLHTELQLAGESAISERFYSWYELDRCAAYGRIKGSSRGGSDPRGKIGANWNLQDATASLYILPIDSSLDQQIAWLHSARPRYLETFANLADVLFDHTRENHKPDIFINIGEILRGHLREKLDRQGIRAVDVYSSMEAGILAQECPHCKALHVTAETSLLELIDDLNREAQPGALGRVVVTPFYSYAMPLIRYELGDRAVATKDQQCSIKLPALREIVGRERQPFVLRGGERRWLPLRSSELSKYLNYRQFQIAQTAIGRIEIRVVDNRDELVKDVAGLNHLISTWMTEPTIVEVIKVETIERQPNGKLQDVVCQLQ